MLILIIHEMSLLKKQERESSTIIVYVELLMTQQIQ